MDNEKHAKHRLGFRCLIDDGYLAKKTNKAFIHPDQGVQYTSGDWQTFRKGHNLEASMGRSHDNAVASHSFRCSRKIK